MNKVLIVDDDREIVDLLSIYCKNEGYDPIKAYDGVDAFRKLEENADIQLIILDVMMPKKDGISVVKGTAGTEQSYPDSDAERKIHGYG